MRMLSSLPPYQRTDCKIGHFLDTPNFFLLYYPQVIHIPGKDLIQHFFDPTKKSYPHVFPRLEWKKNCCAPTHIWA